MTAKLPQVDLVVVGKSPAMMPGESPVMVLGESPAMVSGESPVMMTEEHRVRMVVEIGTEDHMGVCPHMGMHLLSSHLAKVTSPPTCRVPQDPILPMTPLSPPLPNPDPKFTP